MSEPTPTRTSAVPGVAAHGPIRRSLDWLATPSGVRALFLIGLLVRLVLARGGGFPFDMSSFAAWSARLAERGPWDFYPNGGEEFFVDYPPGYLYILWIVGIVADVVLDGPPPVLWLKLPPIAADLVLAWLVMIAAERLAPATVSRRIPVRTIAAAAVLLNPPIFFVSAVWGQADSVPSVLVVAALLLIGTGPPSFRREAGGIALLAVAVGTKPQTGFIIPMVVLALVWRHVRGRLDAADGAHARRRAAWSGGGRVAVLGLCGVVAGFLLFLPFRLFPFDAFEFYRHASRTYQVTSVFAFNFWGAVGFWRADSGADAVTFMGVPVVFWGIALFVALGALVLGRAWAALREGQDEGRVLVFGSLALTLVAFAVVTRIHERYLFVPIVLLAMFVAMRWMRWALVALSAAYFVNVFFPYVYYLEFVDRPAPKLWGLFDAFYGTDINGGRMKVLSLVVTAVCLFIAWRGWRGMEAVGGTATPALAPEGESAPLPLPGEEKQPWALRLHAVGRRRAAVALGVFALALLSRIAGLGHPPGMYFDEVYHARTGAEYLGGKEVFEYTHPPLAKELMGFSIHHLSGFRAVGGGPLPAGISPRLLAPRSNGMVWVRSDGGDSRIHLGRIDADCAAEPVTSIFRSDIRADAIAATPRSILLAGTSADGSLLVRIDGQDEAWRANLPGRAASIATVGDRAYVVTETGDLVTVSDEGEPETLAIGARSLSASDADEEVWVAFGGQRRIAMWDAAGERQAVIEVDGEPTAIAVSPETERVFVTVGDEIISYDTESRNVHSRVGGGASFLEVVPEMTLVWAVEGADIRVLEPHSAVVIGRARFEAPPQVLTTDPVGHRLVAATDNALQCASGRPQFAWRLGSAIFGAAMVALAFLIALRLTGNIWVGLLSALFLAVEGLAFTISRIAMNDSYVTAFILASWFCALSALRTWGRAAGDDADHEVFDRPRTLVWLALGGIFGGLGLASKWVALYGLAGIGLLFLWDGFRRNETSIWRVAGSFPVSVAVIAIAYGVVPLAIYAASYIPYFGLGHSVADFFRLQESMFSYHATLTATHPFGSPWYGWPFGYRAVFLYLDGSGAERSEIWTTPNLVVLWGGLVALVAAARHARRARSAALGVVILAALVQYVPWIAVSRVTFMYHYLPVVPFLAIALAWWLVVGLRDTPRHRAGVIAVSSAAVVMFGLLYPILVGWDMPTWYLDGVRDVLPWVIP